MIQPTWFLYGKESGKMYICTSKTARKVQNIRRNPDKIYFSIEDENYPYKGVKGRAVATISEDLQKNLSTMERINMKYLGTLEHPLAKMLMENTRTGIGVAIEITPLLLKRSSLCRSRFRYYSMLIPKIESILVTDTSFPC